MVTTPSSVFGSPAGYSRYLARRARTGAFAASLIGVGCLLLVLSYRAVLIPGLAVAAVCFYYVRVSLVKATKASVGTKSEVRVARLLNKLGYEATMHGMVLGAGGDCDHVVVGPINCAIETKTGHGKVTFRDGAMYAGSRRIPKNPVAQVERQCQVLSRLTGRRATGVVCVVDMTTRPFRVGDVTVCSLNDLADVLSRTPRVFPAGALAFAQNLYAQQDQMAAQAGLRLQKR
jgi:hypothetical protein